MALIQLNLSLCILAETVTYGKQMKQAEIIFLS